MGLKKGPRTGGGGAPHNLPGTPLEGVGVEGKGDGGRRVSGKGLPMGAKQRDQEVRDGSVDGKRPGSDNLIKERLIDRVLKVLYCAMRFIWGSGSFRQSVMIPALGSKLLYVLNNVCDSKKTTFLFPSVVIYT